MSEADYAVGALLLAGLAWEVYALRSEKPGDTISETTRRWFRVRTRTGRLTFALLWASFSVWYLLHIIK